MDKHKALTNAQREVLEAMAGGHKMMFSQDGDMAWLWPKHPTGFLTNEQTIGIREAGYIAPEEYDEDDYGRFGPPDVITTAGRAALSSSPLGKGERQPVDNKNSGGNV